MADFRSSLRFTQKRRDLADLSRDYAFRQHGLIRAMLASDPFDRSFATDDATDDAVLYRARVLRNVKWNTNYRILAELVA